METEEEEFDMIVKSYRTLFLIRFSIIYVNIDSLQRWKKDLHTTKRPSLVAKNEINMDLRKTSDRIGSKIEYINVK